MKNNILKKFRSYTQKKYKSLRSSVFLFIHGKIILSKKPPNTKFTELRSSILKGFFKHKYKFFEMKNGRVFTNNVENLSIISENKLLDNFSYQQINGKLVKSKNNEVIKKGTPRFIYKIKGSLAILAQGASGYNNYAHCLFDIVPKIKLISMGIDLKKIDFFYYSKLNKFQKEIFKTIGIRENKIIDSNKYRHVTSDKIFGVTHPNYTNGTIFEAHSRMPQWIIYFLRKKFLTNKRLKSNFKKIFIDRSDSKNKHCKLINNNEIKNFLKSRGFKILRLSKFNFKKQISIFNNAKIIIGPHGAGFANLAFCKKNTKVIELKPSNHPNKVYKRVCEINKLKYELIKIKEIRTSKKGDMFLRKKVLEKYL